MIYQSNLGISTKKEFLKLRAKDLESIRQEAGVKSRERELAEV